MFCGQCGNQMPEGARFCSACGAPLTPQATAGWPGAYNSIPPAAPYIHRLQRPRANRMVAGVCAGLAQHYGWELTWVRVITALLIIFSSGAAFIAYVIFWIVMPEEPWALPQAVSPAVPPVESAPPPPPVV